MFEDQELKSQPSVAERLYITGLMLYLNACVGEAWEELLLQEGWEDRFGEVLMREADVIARHLDEEKLSPHAEELSSYYEQLKMACYKNAEPDLAAAIFCLGKLGYHGAQMVAVREVAKSKIEQSRKLLRKRLTPIEARKRALLDIWLSGKYSSRDRCAEEEWEALSFPSFRAARESLNGSPAPTKTR